MYKGTKIPSELLNAYKSTNFEVLTQETFVLKIHYQNEHLRSLYKQYLINTACFITAYNPFSETVSKLENEEAQLRLLEDIKASELPYFSGIGSDPSGEWEGEPSFLILGISKNSAEALGKRYQQNAIVWCDDDCTPELLLLR